MQDTQELITVDIDESENFHPQEAARWLKQMGIRHAPIKKFFIYGRCDRSKKTKGWTFSFFREEDAVLFKLMWG